MSDNMIERLEASKTSEQLLIITVPHINEYKAKANFYEKQNDKWIHVYKNMYAVAGKNGLMYDRKQNTGTSPVGDFGFVFGFGIKKDPGILYEYRQVGEDAYWVTDPESELYNRWQTRISRMG